MQAQNIWVTTILSPMGVDTYTGESSISQTLSKSKANLEYTYEKVEPQSNKIVAI